MNRKLASALSITATTAAAGLAAAAIASGHAHADDITIGAMAFVSAKTRAEVRAAAMDRPLTSAACEWATPLDVA